LGAGVPRPTRNLLLWASNRDTPRQDRYKCTLGSTAHPSRGPDNAPVWEQISIRRGGTTSGIVAPRMLRRVYEAELKLLDRYARETVADSRPRVRSIAAVVSAV
jgi:hypothetical protein